MTIEPVPEKCLTGLCGECAACINTRAEQYHKSQCPGCQDVKSVSSRRYSHEDLWSAENAAHEEGIRRELEAILIYGRAYAEEEERTQCRLALLAFLDSLEDKDHHV